MDGLTARLVMLGVPLLLGGCETRTLQSCLASIVLLGPAEVNLQCPPHDFYAKPGVVREDRPEGDKP